MDQSQLTISGFEQPERLRAIMDRKTARLLRGMRVRPDDARALALEREGLVRRVASCNPSHYTRFSKDWVYVWTPTEEALSSEMEIG